MKEGEGGKGKGGKGNLTKDDLDFWQKEMDRVHEAIELAISGKPEIAMNQFNRKG